MKEILHEYGFLIIAVIVVVALIVIVSAAKTRIAKSAEGTTTTLDNMSTDSLNKASEEAGKAAGAVQPTK